MSLSIGPSPDNAPEAITKPRHRAGKEQDRIPHSQTQPPPSPASSRWVHLGTGRLTIQAGGQLQLSLDI